jgi:hypothetical protein
MVAAELGNPAVAKEAAWRHARAAFYWRYIRFAVSTRQLAWAD